MHWDVCEIYSYCCFVCLTRSLPRGRRVIWNFPKRRQFEFISKVWEMLSVLREWCWGIYCELGGRNNTGMQEIAQWGACCLSLVTECNCSTIKLKKKWKLGRVCSTHWGKWNAWRVMVGKNGGKRRFEKGWLCRWIILKWPQRIRSRKWGLQLLVLW